MPQSNLKQLHTAIFAYAIGNEERLPDLSTGNLQSLIDGGHIESKSKLGICPGAGAKPELPSSSYAGGPDLDGTKKLSSAGINSNTIVLEDAETTYHKAGKNAIRLDGSFRQGGGNIATSPPPRDLATEGLHAVNQALDQEQFAEVRRLLALDPPLDLNQEVPNVYPTTTLLISALILLAGKPAADKEGIMAIIETILSYGADPDFAYGGGLSARFAVQLLLPLPDDEITRLNNLFDQYDQ